MTKTTKEKRVNNHDKKTTLLQTSQTPHYKFCLLLWSLHHGQQKKRTVFNCAISCTGRRKVNALLRKLCVFVYPRVYVCEVECVCAGVCRCVRLGE